MHLLGSGASLSPKHLATRPDKARLKKLRRAIETILTEDLLSPDDARKLRGGGVGFPTALLMAKIGRARAKQLVSRQYASRGGRIADDLHRHLVWWRTAVSTIRPRITSFSRGASVGSHADAQGDGRIEERYNYHNAKTISSHLPKWFSRLDEAAGEESPITLYELSAVILMAFALDVSCVGRFPRLLTTRQIIKQPSMH